LLKERQGTESMHLGSDNVENAVQLSVHFTSAQFKSTSLAHNYTFVNIYVITSSFFRMFNLTNIPVQAIGLCLEQQSELFPKDKWTRS